MANVNIVRLEQAFRYWEDMCLICYAGYKQSWSEFRRNQKYVPVAWENAPKFREYLVDAYGQALDYDTFVSRSLQNYGEIARMGYFPIAMHAWVNKSRRVYHISDHVRSELYKIPLAGIRWSDIRLPFDAFAISLDTSVHSHDRRTSYNCAIVHKTRFEDKNYIGFFLCDTRLADYEPFSDDKVAKINWAIKKERWNKVAKKIGIQPGVRRQNNGKSFRLSMEDDFCPSIWYEENDWEQSEFDLRDIFNTFVTSDGTEENPSFLPYAANQFFIMAIRLSLFLRAKPPVTYEKIVSPLVSNKVESCCSDETKFAEMITFGSEICTLSGSTIGMHEGKVVKLADSVGSGRTVITHKRAGYYRRPCGKGNDPGCPKTVWVNSTTVNPHLCPEGAIPEGCNQKF